VLCNDSSGYFKVRLQLLGRSSHLKICKLLEDNAYSRHNPPFILHFCSTFHWMFEFQYWFCNTNSGEHLSNCILLFKISAFPFQPMDISQWQHCIRHSIQNSPMPFYGIEYRTEYSVNVQRCYPEDVFRVVILSHLWCMSSYTSSRK